jgi:hypothetical protein
MRRMAIASGIVVLAVGVGMGSSSRAATQLREIQAQGGPACQLSVPTTDTKVRPKAIGFRNEGTTNAFVICSLPFADGTFSGIELGASTLDGHPASTSMSCTATNGRHSPDMSVDYVTKSGQENGGQRWFGWTPSDFTFNGGGYISITCLLPAQTSIDSIDGYYYEDVGN